MENRASYLLVGGFVLLVTGVAFAFVVWLTRAQMNQEFAYYDIFFSGSVAGLGLGGDVRYRGIKVGTVESIGVDVDDPSRVRVTARLDTDTPIREGDTASLELQGITGVSFVNIEGAGPDSPPLASRPGRARPVIPSRKSTIERLFTGAPDLLARTVTLMERFAAVLSDENQRAISGILADVHQLTSTLSGRRHEVGRIIDTVDRLSTRMLSLSESANALAVELERLSGDASATLAGLREATSGVDAIVRDDVKLLVGELRLTNRELGDFARSANAVLAENREPLKQFSGEGLQQFSEFLKQASVLFNNIARLTERLDSEGARFLIDNQQSEFVVEDR